ncbi:hypothetical protein [Fervidibacillus albus]|uniref:Uncharacterized protein n=1 Tax=Fervidibacillus albus TaxID=2980026 RepID=A0A9E8LVK5_9BACI|nr:hypothetical protein [Fervidibacillus albus]WAA10311.1 hypothetical protein OE104_02960 [Fervidibacillus albus]
MVQTFGFDTKPYSVIFWVREDEITSKTICYSQDDERNVKHRFFTPRDFYNGFKKALIYRGDQEQQVLEKEG